MADLNDRTTPVYLSKYVVHGDSLNHKVKVIDGTVKRASFYNGFYGGLVKPKSTYSTHYFLNTF